ncbi:hypothetical protein ES705_18766 [subsurface metagenome]
MKTRLVLQNIGNKEYLIVYGEQLKLLLIEDLKSKYKIENVDYQIRGKLKDGEFKAIIACMRDSDFITAIC